ncbi:hypothetical protein, partial [Plasmodium yoelii yoelii]
MALICVRNIEVDLAYFYKKIYSIFYMRKCTIF